MDNVLIMGVGGAGMYIAKHVKKLLGGKAVAVNTDELALRRSDFEAQLLLVSALHKDNIRNISDRGRQAAEKSVGELSNTLEGVDTLILLAGLGGSTGTGAVPVIAALAKSMGIRVVVAVVMPFKFEGERRDVAFNALAELQSEGVTVLVHDNAYALDRSGDSQESLAELFERSADKISSDVRAVLY